MYDILRKREDDLQDNHKKDIINVLFQDKNIRDNKEFLSTEGSDTKNINNINLELHSENQLYDLIKVKRNNFIKINENINDIKKASKEKIIEDDLLSAENKKLKKRYIFEKLNRKQFISVNNNELNNIITESKSNTDEKKEKIINKEITKERKDSNINVQIKKEDWKKLCAKKVPTSRKEFSNNITELSKNIINKDIEKHENLEIEASEGSESESEN